jgi:hypothetical protein
MIKVDEKVKNDKYLKMDEVFFSLEWPGVLASLFKRYWCPVFYRGANYRPLGAHPNLFSSLK